MGEMVALPLILLALVLLLRYGRLPRVFSGIFVTKSVKWIMDFPDPRLQTRDGVRVRAGATIRLDPIDADSAPAIPQKHLVQRINDGLTSALITALRTVDAAELGNRRMEVQVQVREFFEPCAAGLGYRVLELKIDYLARIS